MATLGYTNKNGAVLGLVRQDATAPSQSGSEGNFVAPGATSLRAWGEQVVGIAGIDKIGTAGAQQSFHLLDCLLDHTARLAGLNLAPQLDERLIGVVQTPRQDCCSVKECDRVYPE